MAFVPTFKLFDSGYVLQYTFPVVQETNIPQTVQRSVVLKGQRAKGAIVIDGGEDTWDLIVKGLHYGEDYDTIQAAIVAMETAIDLNTSYIIRFDKTISTYYEYNVKRIKAISYPASLRTDSQEYTVTFLANSW